MIVDTPADLLARHSIAVQGLVELQRLGTPALIGLPPFIGLTGPQVIEALAAARIDVDERYVLAVFAAIEAAFKSDMRWRVHKGKGTRPETKALRSLIKDARWERVRLEDLLKLWRDQAIDRRPFSELRRISHRRHWLAHGKYFSDVSGVGAIEPADVVGWYNLAAREARAIAPDFPRDDHEI